jgi:hypothetical protein
VAADCGCLCALLVEQGIGHVVCVSGPSGGRHVWMALAAGVDPALVASLARKLGRLLPSLDISPLLNPATGCLRPPGAPHRSGTGVSEIVAGSTGTLMHAGTSVAQMKGLDAALSVLVDDELIDAAPALLPQDETGHLFVPVARRALDAHTLAALHTASDEYRVSPGQDGSLSALAWHCLTGMAEAGWRFGDVLPLAVEAPGMEHYRTIPSNSGGQRRVLRTAREQLRLLEADWGRACGHVAGRVIYAASFTPPPGADPTFMGRSTTITSLVAAEQVRADAAVGRWTRPGGASDRQVLDVLHLLARQAVNECVAVDLRRLRAHTHRSIATLHTALQRLAEDGWIGCVSTGQGRTASTYQIAPNKEPQVGYPQDSETDRTQVPAQGGRPPRSLLIEHLTSRSRLAGLDCFAHTGVGIGAGLAYSRLSEGIQERSRPRPWWRRWVPRLAEHGLVIEAGGVVRAAGESRCVAVAVELGLAGRGAAIEARCLAEADAWRWWINEVAWLSARRDAAGRKPVRPQHRVVTLDLDRLVRSPYPRCRNQRPSWRQAVQACIEARTRPDVAEFVAMAGRASRRPPVPATGRSTAPVGQQTRRRPRCPRRDASRDVWERYVHRLVTEGWL